MIAPEAVTGTVEDIGGRKLRLSPANSFADVGMMRDWVRRNTRPPMEAAVDAVLKAHESLDRREQAASKTLPDGSIITDAAELDRVARLRQEVNALRETLALRAMEREEESNFSMPHELIQRIGMTPQGLTFLVWLHARRNHPELTEQEVGKLTENMDYYAEGSALYVKMMEIDTAGLEELGKTNPTVAAQLKKRKARAATR